MKLLLAVALVAVAAVVAVGKLRDEHPAVTPGVPVQVNVHMPQPLGTAPPGQGGGQIYIP